MKTAEEIRYKYMPNGAINLKLVGGGNGKPQYEYEKMIMIQMLEEYANQFKPQIANHKQEQDLKKLYKDDDICPCCGGDKYFEGVDDIICMNCDWHIGYLYTNDI